MELNYRQLELLIFAVEDCLFDRYFEDPDAFPEGDYDQIEDLLETIKRTYAFNA